MQVLYGRPPDDRVHSGAALNTCVVFVLTYLMRLKPGSAVCRITVSITWVCRDSIWFGFVRIALLLEVVFSWVDRCFVPGCFWAYSVFSV